MNSSSSLLLAGPMCELFVNPRQTIIMPYELGRQYEVWDCPFCGQNTISIIHFPKSVNVKRSKTASLPGSKGFHVSPDVYVISGGCPKCGKAAEEVEKKFKSDGIL